MMSSVHSVRYVGFNAYDILGSVMALSSDDAQSFYNSFFDFGSTV
jgi:hypothetical protein